MLGEIPAHVLHSYIVICLLFYEDLFMCEGRGGISSRFEKIIAGWRSLEFKRSFKDFEYKLATDGAEACREKIMKLPPPPPSPQKSLITLELIIKPI
jgi:hypothetical protein